MIFFSWQGFQCVARYQNHMKIQKHFSFSRWQF